MRGRAQVWRGAAVLVMLAVTLTAWGAGQSGATTDAGAPQEIRWLGFFEFVPDATSETFIFAELGRRTNSTIVPMHIPRSDFETKLATIFDSGDLP